ncbi:SDR family oxidoreductase [Aurantivibrio plasticivorans]
MTLRIDELFTVAGKVAVVTGGSRGIGYMIAHALVENGAKVYITARKAGPCLEAAAELSTMGECIAIPGDLATDEGRQKFVDDIKQRESKIDILVNNAGAAWGAPFESFPDDGYDKVFNINVRAIFMLTRDLLPLLEKDASRESPSKIINIGSIDGLRISTTDNYSYGASKAAVHHLTKNLAVRLADKGLNINAIAPGPFESKMMAQTLKDHKERIESGIPMGRIGRPQDMGSLALFLSSPASNYVTGQIIALDGGSNIANAQKRTDD